MIAASTRIIATVTTATALTLGACSVIPQIPEPVKTDVVPSATPEPLDATLIDSPYGFSVPERAAFRIRNDGCDSFGTGSGFAIDAHTIVTNAHVIENTYELEVNGHDGRDYTIVSSTVSTIGDLGIITIAEELDFWVDLSEDDPSRRDDVLVAGYPSGDELTVATGRVLGVADDTLDNAEFVFETNVQIEPGSSGSAAYGADGLVIGVIYATADDDSVLESSYMVPVSILNETLADETTLKDNAPACDL